MQPGGRKAGERSQIPLAEVSRMDKDIDEPGDRDELDELDDASEPWPPAGYPPPRNATRRGRRVAALAATAVLAAGAGFAVVTAALRDGTASPAANASPGANQPG